jgi:hypothetical protein
MSLRSRASDTAWLFSFAACCLATAAPGEDPLRSPASDKPLPGVIRAPLPSDEVQGLPLATVFYDLRGTAGITGGDERARLEIEQAFGIRAGDVFAPQVVQVGLTRVRQLRFVRQAHFAVYESSRQGHLALAISVTLGPRDDVAGPRGMATGRAGDFPTLYQDERSSLSLLLNGGIGLYSDGNPWFGDAAAFTGRSPIALDPANGDSATWFESSIEYGLDGIMQLGAGNVWAYGANTWLTSFATGQDLFRADTRDRTAIEDAYVGIVFQPEDSPWVVNASLGRQNWQMNDGFLFSQFAGSANAGPLPGLYLNPRTAYEMTALLKIHRDNFRIEAFYLDPNEISFLDSDTTFAGLNASYRFPAGWEASLAYYEVPESKTAFVGGTVPREGQQTGNARVATTQMFGIDGLEWGGELAYQTSRDVDWDAWAWYSRVGYTFHNLPWTPNLSYRYASFGGDDPHTSTYEGFDAPLSSGLDTWVQGVNVRKVASNGNLDSHRVRLNLAASPKLSLTFDYFYLMANQAAGGPDEIAQEIDLGIRWSITPNLFFLGVAGIAFPDDRLENQAGNDLSDWTTMQASLFWNF